MLHTGASRPATEPRAASFDWRIDVLTLSSFFLNFAFVTFVLAFQVRRIIAQLAASPEAKKEKGLIRGQGEDVLPGFSGSRAWCGELGRPCPMLPSNPWLSSFWERLEGGRGDLVRSLGSSVFILEVPVSEEGERLPSWPVSYMLDSPSAMVAPKSSASLCSLELLT